MGRQKQQISTMLLPPSVTQMCLPHTSIRSPKPSEEMRGTVYGQGNNNPSRCSNSQERGSAGHYGSPWQGANLTLTWPWGREVPRGVESGWEIGNLYRKNGMKTEEEPGILGGVLKTAQLAIGVEFWSRLSCWSQFLKWRAYLSALALMWSWNLVAMTMCQSWEVS